jgi:SAM-dependent methyltransferase
MQKVSFQQHWRTVAKRWQEIPAPMHPWQSEIKIYQRLAYQVLKNVRNPRILILGATPEMRDIAHNIRNSEVTCVDIDMNMILAMGQLLKNPDKAKQETWIRSNWVTVPLLEGNYDLILGEAVLGNVGRELWPNFLNHLKNILRPNGHFITRIVAHDLGDWHGKTLEEVFDYASAHRLNFMELYFLLFYRIFGGKHVLKMSNVDMYKTIQRFYNKNRKKYVLPDKYVEGLLNKIAKYLPASPFQWSNGPKRVAEKYLSRYFNIKGEYYGHGESAFNAAYHPIYLLKK